MYFCYMHQLQSKPRPLQVGHETEDEPSAPVSLLLAANKAMETWVYNVGTMLQPIKDQFLLAILAQYCRRVNYPLLDQYFWQYLANIGWNIFANIASKYWAFIGCNIG